MVVDTVLDQPLGALRDVSYQLFCGDEILESAFEQRPDKLCVARQLAELMRLPLQEVLSEGGGSKASRPERSDHSASGAKPRCSTWTARAACWTSTSLRSRSSGPWPSRAGTATPRLLLQIRPHGREVRADRGPGPGQIPGREEARRNAGVQGLARVGGRGRQRGWAGAGVGAGAGADSALFHATAAQNQKMQVDTRK